MMQLVADGSCAGNPGRGGWAFLLIESDQVIYECSGFELLTTNNRMELIGIVKGLEYYQATFFNKVMDPLEIISDSKYVLEGLEKWLSGWLKRGWKTSDNKAVKNQDLWLPLNVLKGELNLKFRWVKGHAGHKWNERADELAQTACRNQRGIENRLGLQPLIHKADSWRQRGAEFQNNSAPAITSHITPNSAFPMPTASVSTSNFPKNGQAADVSIPVASASFSSLHALSPLDGRYSGKIDYCKQYFSEHALLTYRCKVELLWLKYFINKVSQFDSTVEAWSEQATQLQEQILSDLNNGETNLIKDLEKTTNHDVKAVEYYLRSKLQNSLLSPYLEWIHIFCTSEDINNLAYALMLQDFKDQSLLPLLNDVSSWLDTNASEYAAVPMLAFTHGQPASPTSLGKELKVFSFRLARQIKKIKDFKFLGKFNGSVGCYNPHVLTFPDWDWIKISEDFIFNELGLSFNPLTTQIESHDSTVEFFALVNHSASILTGLSQDIWGYISRGYFKLRNNEKEVGSSVMPHKVNPIDFENAEGNLIMCRGMLQALEGKLPISRFQRDLADSTLQRNMGVGLGYFCLALESLKKGLSKLTINSERMQKDLLQAHEVLAEPVQSVLRWLKVTGGYELMKQKTRGQNIDKDKIAEIIAELEIPEFWKNKLQQLTPENYIGLASHLANLDTTPWT